MNKTKFGQFYTTNAKKILKGFKVPNNVNIIEPFCGNGDLLNAFGLKEDIVECYDIDPSINSHAIQRDCLLDPPVYTNKFIITNPPFLQRSLAEHKEVFDLYGQDDLYKCFLVSLLDQAPCLGGIFILPFNFLVNVQVKNLRDAFFEIYEIQRLNIFDEHVFEDTHKAICSFEFYVRKSQKNNQINTYFYPSGEHKKIDFGKALSIYDLPISSEYDIKTLTKKDTKVKKYILLEALDPIRLKIVNAKDADFSPSRYFYYLVIEPKIPYSQQKILVKKWNSLLKKYRSKYHSLFLGNFKDQRKYINLKLAKIMLLYLLR